MLTDRSLKRQLGNRVNVVQQNNSMCCSSNDELQSHSHSNKHLMWGAQLSAQDSWDLS